jgi:four helix bundle protein
VSDYRRLKVWEKSHHAVLGIYAATAKFPATERFGLTAQLRRAAISVPSNIAEGTGRRGTGEFRRFLTFALGSAHDLEYQLLLARDLGFLTGPDYQRLAGKIFEVGRMLNGLITRLDGPGGKDRKRAA